jgi:nitroreductase
MNWAGQGTLFNLRRSIHRLEKGLSFPERRSVFAEDYILDTVELLLKGRNDPGFDTPTLNWATAVLDRYFHVVERTPVVTRALDRYSEGNRSAGDPSMAPYPANERPGSETTFDELRTLAKRRRSVRFYTGEPVPEAVVRQALSVAAEAPSACNRQAFQYLYFNEPGTVASLADVPGGIAGYTVPSLIVVVGRYRGYFDERDVKAPIIDASLSVMGFILALETLGASSVCINWPNQPGRERRLRRLLDLEPDEFVVMMIGLGYADPSGLVPYSAKRPDDELLVVNGRLARR